MNNEINYLPDDTFQTNIEWFNLEDLLRTLQNRKQGIDKKRLRPLLIRLEEQEFIQKREGGKQNRPQSKGEYKITELGQVKLQNYIKARNQFSF